MFYLMEKNKKKYFELQRNIGKKCTFQKSKLKKKYSNFEKRHFETFNINSKL